MHSEFKPKVDLLKSELDEIEQLKLKIKSFHSMQWKLKRTSVLFEKTKHFAEYSTLSDDQVSVQLMCFFVLFHAFNNA